jgi:hypothetical protein
VPHSSFLFLSGDFATQGRANLQVRVTRAALQFRVGFIKPAPRCPISSLFCLSGDFDFYTLSHDFDLVVVGMILTCHSERSEEPLWQPELRAPE